MKRIFVILALLFTCGLGASAAIIGEGRMAHIRRFAPQILPLWSSVVADDATILRGQTNDLGRGIATATQAHWQLANIGTDGATWQVAIGGDGIDLAAEVRIPPGIAAAFLDKAAGEIDLTTLETSVQLGGLAIVDNFNARFDRKQAVLTGANGQLRWLGAQLDGHNIGLGKITLTSGEGIGTGWEAQFSIQGDLVTATGQIAGRFNSQSAMLDMTVSDAGAMPESWKNILSVLVRPKNGSWLLRRRVDLAKLLGQH